MTVVPAMRRVNVLFMPHPAAIDPSWGDDVVAAIAGSHELRVFDPEREAGPQFQKVEAIVDLGGNISGKLVDAAADAGVRFIQAQTNGLDHVEVDRILDAGMILCHCPGHLSSVALADRAMMFVLMLAHRYDEGRRTFMRGELYSPNGMEPEGAAWRSSDSATAVNCWPAAPGRSGCGSWGSTCGRSSSGFLMSCSPSSWVAPTTWTASSPSAIFSLPTCI